MFCSEYKKMKARTSRQETGSSRRSGTRRNMWDNLLSRGTSNTGKKNVQIQIENSNCWMELDAGATVKISQRRN